MLVSDSLSAPIACLLFLFQEATTIVSIDDYEDVPAYSEASLMQAVSMQPVSVAIEADETAFQFYNSVWESGTSHMGEE